MSIKSSNSLFFSPAGEPVSLEEGRRIIKELAELRKAEREKFEKKSKDLRSQINFVMSSLEKLR